MPGVPQGDNRAYNAGQGMSDSDDSIRRGGGEDPRREAAKIVIERKIADNDQSGYSHANSAGSQAYAEAASKKAAGMGTPNVDGTYSTS